MLYGRNGILNQTGLGSRRRLPQNGRERPERETSSRSIAQTGRRKNKCVSALALLYMGLDIAKRTMEVCIVQDGEASVQRVSRMKTNRKGRERLARLLRGSEVAEMEAGAYAFRLARYPQEAIGCVV